MLPSGTGDPSPPGPPPSNAAEPPPQMFAETPASVPIAKAGSAPAKGFEIMSYHERRLSHDVIQLRSEQQKMSAALAKLKIDLSTVMMSSGIEATTGGPPTAASSAVPNADSGYKPVAEVLAGAGGNDSTMKELNGAFEQMEARMMEDRKTIARLEAMQADGGASVVADEAGLGRLRQDVQFWKAQVDAKMQDVLRKLEKVHKILPQVALKTSRIALRAVDMRPEDRKAALAVTELKEDQMGKNLGTPKPAGAAPTGGDMTPRTDFNATLNEITNLGAVPIVPDSGPNSGNTTPRSVMAIPDEMPEENAAK